MNATADQANTALLSSRVLDAETGEPISKFIALAGVNPIEGLGWQWQPHTTHEFSDGQLQWPPSGKAGYKEQVLRIESDGYVPYQTPLIRRLPNGDAQVAGDIEDSSGNEAPRIIAVRSGEPTSLEIRLRRDPGITGRVLSPTGEPVAGADVAVAMANDQNVELRDGKLGFSERPLGRRWPKTYRMTKTDADGKFKLTTEIQTAAVVVAHSFGVAVLSYSEFKESPEIELQPWGRIEGQVVWGDTPGSGEKVSLIAHGGKPTKDFQPTFMVYHFQGKEADENGRFVFEHVPPGRAQLSCHQPTQLVEVLPGTPTHVVVGGRGRPVIGKLVGRSSWEDVWVRIAPNAPRPGDMGTEYDPWPAYLKEFFSHSWREALMGGKMILNRSQRKQRRVVISSSRGVEQKWSRKAAGGSSKQDDLCCRFTPGLFKCATVPTSVVNTTARYASDFGHFSKLHS